MRYLESRAMSVGVTLLALLLPASLAAAQAAAVDNDYVQFPGGVQIYKSCIYKAPFGAHLRIDGTVSDKDGHTLFVIPPCPYPKKIHRASFASPQHPPTVDGWAEWAEASLPNSYFDYIYADWTVPALPIAEDGQIVYFFNSLQDSAQDQILQPVLQYFGGNSGWQMQTYVVDGDYVVESRDG